MGGEPTRKGSTPFPRDRLRTYAVRKTSISTTVPTARKLTAATLTAAPQGRPTSCQNDRKVSSSCGVEAVGEEGKDEGDDSEPERGDGAEPKRLHDARERLPLSVAHGSSLCRSGVAASEPAGTKHCVPDVRGAQITGPIISISFRPYARNTQARPISARIRLCF